MDINASGFWLMPTHGRAATNLPRFFAKAKETGMTTPGFLIVENDDYRADNEAYDALDMPDNWSVYLVDAGCCAAATEQAYIALCDTASWVGWLADDLEPETQGWDVKVVEALTGWNCVSTNDGMYGIEKFNGATAWSGDLLRAVGYIYPAGLTHFYFDTAWEELGLMMNIWTRLPDVMVRHAHTTKTGRVDETTIRTHKAWKTDEAAFTNWKNKERLAAANRIGDLLLQYGVTEALPSLSGIHVMIATPCGDGRYERLFMQSLFGTIEVLRQCGAVVNFAEIPYCSDIALARNKIFGQFYRSGATHLLSIDSDMGWSPADVVKLFGYKRDFVAVAGPRKVFPPSFAVRNTGDNGMALPLRQDGDGLFEVSHIGMAFTLLTRDWADRMVQAYSDLEYAGDDGRTDYAIFNPMVVRRRYMSEDFAACERWHALGGKVYVDASISLQHVGSFVWQGDWRSHLINEAAQQQRAA